MDIKEAAEYYHIGEKKFREMAEVYSDYGFFLMNGNRLLIKREKFQEFLENATAI